MKHLKEIIFDSGVTSLINTDKLHDTYYKHYRMNLVNSKEQVKLSFQLNFVTEA